MLRAFKIQFYIIIIASSPLLFFFNLLYKTLPLSVILSGFAEVHILRVLDIASFCRSETEYINVKYVRFDFVYFLS